MNNLKLLPIIAIILACVLALPTPTHAFQTDPAAQCAEGLQLFWDGKTAEALSLLEESFAGREKAAFVSLDYEGSCVLTLGFLRDDLGNRSGA